ncbi:hypothetical protein BC941DRAFT_509079 [Chlamydoabsidia padenii]|nr:hypothetical protein BC941DRAFT_98601 [Chlamydoabsidia padenii]KAI8343664.1 hypothetical protein BC941DRAFT_509079 [Chlamydoabsidia padenii]
MTVTLLPEDDCFAKLNTLTLPDQEINDLLAQHITLTAEEKTKQLSNITTSIAQWIETIHLTLFTLEQNIKQNNSATTQDTNSLDDVVQRMNPVIDSLSDLVDIMEDIDDNSLALSARSSITKIQSEWSGLQHFLSSVKQALAAVDEENQLRILMDQVLVQIEDLSLLVFQYQEQRSSGQAATMTTLAALNLNNKDNTTTVSNPSNSTSAPDDILVDIDNRVGPVFGHVNKIYNRMMVDTSPPTDATGILGRRHRMIQERWECLRVEIDELKADLKEDRWLTVFKQVADQVESMMDGLDKTVEQCRTMVQQVREWQGIQQLSCSSSSTTVTPQLQQQQQQQQYPVPPKGILRSSKSHHSSASVSSSSSSGSAGSTPPPPVDHIKLRSVEKNFEAKYKYCTPLITKMLSMLGENIAMRAAENNATVARHQHMVQRWQQLKSTMDDLRIRDLPDIERLLLFERPISPAWSKVSDRSDKSGGSHRYKSPEPSSYDFFDYRTSSNSLGSVGGRARSPLSTQQHQLQQLQQLQYHGNNGYMSPTAQLYGMQEEMRRGRSVTPSSGTGSRDHISLWRSTNGASPVHGRTMTRTTSPLSGYQDVLKSSTSDTPSLGSNPSRSPMKHSATSPSLGQEDTFARQSPAPASSRCKSRQEELPYGGRRSVTPVRRAGTPSMIPRPKTPSQDLHQQGGINASQIPRPRSSMLRASPSMMTPSPSSFLSSSSPPPSPPHVPKRTLNRKYSSPILNQQSRNIHDHNRSFAQTPPPPSSRRHYDLAEEDEEEEDFYNNNRGRGDDNNDNDDDDYEDSIYNQQDRQTYIPDPKDPLDVEVAKIINGNPIRIICERGTQSGRYYFGHELNPTPGGGRRLYTCKLMTYTNRERRTNGFGVQTTSLGGKSGTTRKKVLTRVGGGWIDLEIFLLEHHNLMLSH